MGMERAPVRLEGRTHNWGCLGIGRASIVSDTMKGRGASGLS